MTPSGWQSVTDMIQNLAIIVMFVLLLMEHRLRRRIPNIHITLEGKNLLPGGVEETDGTKNQST